MSSCHFLGASRWALSVIITVYHLSSSSNSIALCRSLAKQTREFEARIARGCQVHPEHLETVLTFSAHQDEHSLWALQCTKSPRPQGRRCVHMRRCFGRDKQGSLKPGLHEDVRFLLSIQKPLSLSRRIKMSTLCDHYSVPHGLVLKVGLVYTCAGALGGTNE